MKLNLLVIILFALSSSTFLKAQTRCACTYQDWQGDCSAQVSIVGGQINFEVGTQQCSRIDWYASGEPKVTIVTDGKESKQWSGQVNPEITIQSCKICKDRNFRAPKPQRPETAQSKLQGITHWASVPCDGIYDNGQTFQANLSLVVDNTAVSGVYIYDEGPQRLAANISGTLFDNSLRYTTEFSSRHSATIPPAATFFTETWCHVDGNCRDCKFYRQ